MKKVALIIIYNHQYNQNIEILEKIYENKFNNIYHLVPFYSGERENVIPVYECSYYFQGYVAQGFKQFFKEEYEHYFFVADDMILNPTMNENNYAKKLSLDSSSCFIPELITLHNRKNWWQRVGQAYHWSLEVLGVEPKNQLPSYQEALKRFQRFNLEIKPLTFHQIWKTPATLNDWTHFLLNRGFMRHSVLAARYLKNIAAQKTYHLPYPIVGGYSDIFVVSADAIKEFCHYCGVFATTKLFVEVALPTALVLSAKKIVTENTVSFKGKALWTKEELKELDVYQTSLKHLLENFPSNYLYIHPVKLSKWRTEL